MSCAASWWLRTGAGSPWTSSCVINAGGQRIAAEAPPGETLLCSCFLETRRWRFAVGGSKGYLVISLADAAPPTPVPLGTAAPVLALPPLPAP